MLSEMKNFKLLLSILTISYAQIIVADTLIPSPLLPTSCNGIKELPQKQIGYYYQHDFEKFKEFNLKITEENNNIGGGVFNFLSGKKVVYRSSILNENPKCLEELTKEKGVETVIYLYFGNYIDEKEIPYQEEIMFKKFGGKFYINTLNFDDFMTQEPKDSSSRNKLMASIIKYIEASPGNVLIHCLGGMHRTGLIYGILQKCVQKTPMNEIIKTYNKHVGYKNADNPGTYSKYDIQSIEDYPCDDLN